MGIIRRLMGIGLFGALVLLPVSGVLAQNAQGQDNNNQGHRTVPEINPAVLPAAAALLIGGVALFMTRRRKPIQ